MSEQTLFEQAKVCLEQGKYETAITLLEQSIENDPDDVNYYWHLGLAYLLQEQEENAQATWLLVISQGDENEIEQWTKTLLEILEQEAQRQEQIGNLKLSWLIRGHIREIEPSLINNLLHLIDLEVQLKYYNPQHLEDWQVIDYLVDNFIEVVNSVFLLKLIPPILDFPAFINIDFLQACLKYITSVDALIAILKLTAVKMAYDNHKAIYAIDLVKMGLQLKPDDIELHDRLYQFSFMTERKDYKQMLQSAKDFFDIAKTSDLKTFGYYKIIQTLIASGLWRETQEILPDYIISLQKMASSKPQFIDPIMQGCLQSLVWPLMYLQDEPVLSRQLQNQFSEIFENYLPQWLPFSVKRFNCHVNFPKTLRIGYIAHTLRRHSVGWLSRWLLHYHNQKDFKIHLYLIDQLEDDITQKHFRNKADLLFNSYHPQQIASQIQQDKIDILVDLDSYSCAITCQVLAIKPAPIQVTWLGADASGLTSIDYFIADPYVLPDNAQEYYKETIWRLPKTYLAIDGFEVDVPTLKREDFGISNDAIIYLTVQTGQKRHPDTIRLQMQILQSVANSHLFVKGDGDQQTIQKLFQAIAKEHDIALDRLYFLERSSSEEIHRANLAIADVMLDTYPYNGATTTLETLWMGIPLVTKVGKQFASRNSYTFMINAGLTEGIAWTDEEYVNWGIRLGTDEQLRQQIGCKLWQSRQIAPLWNAKQFTQEMEKAYQNMWLKYINKFSPK